MAAPVSKDTLLRPASLADLERPVSLEALAAQLAPDPDVKRTLPFWKSITAVLVAAIALTLAWRYTPLADVVTAETVIDWTHAFAGNWWAAPLIVAAYTPAQVIMFPRPLITLAAVVAFGPWLGFTYAMGGILIATAAGYYAGQLFDRDTVRRIAGRRLNRLTSALRERGLLAMTAVRLVPIAPFAVESVVAGAIRLRLWHVLGGTFLGMLPGTLTATVFGDQIETALKDPSQINWWLVGGVVLLLAIASYVVQGWFKQMEQRGAKSDAAPQQPATAPRARPLLAPAPWRRKPRGSARMRASTRERRASAAAARRIAAKGRRLLQRYQRSKLR